MAEEEQKRNCHTFRCSSTEKPGVITGCPVARRRTVFLGVDAAQLCSVLIAQSAELSRSDMRLVLRGMQLFAFLTNLEA